MDYCTAGGSGQACQDMCCGSCKSVGGAMEHVSVDILGPLPLSDQGNGYILVAMDYFMKWPEAYAVPDQSTATTTRVFVDEFFCYFGVPEELHSEQGRNFEGRGVF